MAVSTKARPYRDEAARQRLRDAQAMLAQAQIDLETARTEHDAAWRAYREQQEVVDGIQARINALADEWRRVHPMGREDIQRRVDECAEPMRQAKLPLMDLAKAEEAAEAKVKAAEQKIGFYHSHVREAAEAVVRSEAPQVSEILAARVREAFGVLLTYGPDLAYLLGWNMASDDIGAGPRSVLGALHSWDAFHRRYQASRWAGAVDALTKDPDADLPAAPAAPQ
jgi:hypothetical protein